MPRIADHDARRRQVAAAVADLVASDGLDGVTVARTAATAGISVGLVQHYFKSKDDMLLFAFTHVRDRIDARVAEGVAAGVRSGARIEHVLLDALGELLPLDERRHRECRVTLAFAGRTVDNPRLAEALNAGAEGVRARLAEAIHNGKECGEVPVETDDRLEAVRLLSLVDGLALHAFTGPGSVSPDAARAALARHLGTLFPGPCHHPRPAK
ncbi:TetR/AcrR family transcriptional regulator [Virgisporangium aurantiacum]|uniref:HTH-type transcriptional regulator PksA n=1 Tax=Virgisporangium aurantiacum TaxID=175570 RepID=A0A8J3Z7N6_9ACTN|nr:TetR/AcrR family transcriptional regulator [Virgisporangium aurantiacum]GIJ57858.1 HTH-type transcriptional regulator PksA [Virgisporangium aurantiacum]